MILLPVYGSKPLKIPYNLSLLKCDVYNIETCESYVMSYNDVCGICLFLQNLKIINRLWERGEITLVNLIIRWL